MDFLSVEYRDVIRGEFAKELALEPDGILQDECQHHVAQLCFDTTYGASVYAQDRAIIHNLAAMARSAGVPRSNQTFLFAGESPYDWEFDAYHFGYLRSADVLPFWIWMCSVILMLTRVEFYWAMAKYTITLLTLVTVCLLYAFDVTPPVVGCGPDQSYPSRSLVGTLSPV